MSTDDLKRKDLKWPVSKSRFELDFGDGSPVIAFQEVSGLDTDSPVIEYRKSDSAHFSVQKMTGMSKNRSIVLKKGIIKLDHTIWNWIEQHNANRIDKRSITIKLLNEEGKVLITWRLDNAFPIKVISADLKSDGNEVAIETIELSHDGILVLKS